MPATILATKLFAPPPRAEAVLRPRLTRRMNEGRKLTLVCAPAGYGKTTLVGEWAAEGDRPVAWLSLDEGDNDPTRFMTYLVAALRTVEEGVGEGVSGALRSVGPPSVEAMLTALLNEVSAAGRDLVLVLDDYHVIGAKAVGDALAFMLDHLPPRMRLVVATREDPNLPLARLRARNDLTELRAADLRFTRLEAAEFLEEAAGLDLSDGEVGALEARTEGWVSGLQLAAISMKGRDDTSNFIESFTGSHRFILDYLLEEVLHRQPERVRDFLLRTSVLDGMSGPLCDALTGRKDGRGMLEALERGNLFVVPLDDEREWYRYHHLFADALQARSMGERPERIPVLHRRASEWHEENGLMVDAIRHALAAGDFERAASLVEAEARAMLTMRCEETFLGWMRGMPEAVIRTRPILAVYYALALVSVDLESAEIRLRDAERSLADECSRSSANSDEYRSLPGIISIARAYHAGAMGDVSGSMEHARRAWELSPEDDHLWRGAAASLLGLSHWASGDLDDAYRFFADGMERLRKAGDTTQSITGAFLLANIRVAQGCLREAARIYEKALKTAGSRFDPGLLGVADLHVGMSELCYERGDIESATRHLRKCEELDERGAIAENRHRWHVAMSRIKEAEGEPDAALDLLDEAEGLYVRSPDPDVRPISALRARVWIKHGRLAEAAEWARERSLSPGDDLAYLCEFEHITLARMLIARFDEDHAEHSIREAAELLDRLLEAAKGAGRKGSVIEILALRALAIRVRGDMPGALAELDRALALAEPEGYVRIFADEGPPMARLLTEAAERGKKPEHARKLLAFLDSEESGSHSPLAEPLSEREMEVLRLVARGLSNREIGDRLFLAVITVKGHNRNIFRKLGVRRRTEAVARAREIGLF
ncbi:MAG: LuxR C-terminal-related transcriptional regulator [Rubrobacteraceae bacterium]